MQHRSNVVYVSSHPYILLCGGIAQVFTGKMSDHFPKKNMLFFGMLLQRISILLIAYNNFYLFAFLSAILGLVGILTVLSSLVIKVRMYAV